MLRKGALHGRPLHAAAAPMHQPHFAKPCGVGSGQILDDDIDHVARLKAVQVDLSLDRDDDGLVGVVITHVQEG